jgi:hypothetical protein
MSNKIIYPILIIIFSVLIIYGIINNKNNYKLNNNVEKFTNFIPPVSNKKDQVVNYFLDESRDILKSSAANNTLFTTEMINGTWTSDLSTVDSNYNVSNLMSISANNILSSTNYSNNTNDFGSIVYNNQTYRINFLLNENLTAIMLNNVGVPTSQNLHIKFYNNFSKEGQKNINPPFYKPEEFNCVVSIYSYNALINKFASYRVYNNKAGDELYRIIITRNFHIEQAAPIYDYKAYSIITGKYLFPSNFITISFGETNANILNTISTKYQGTIKFCIQRVFYSPTNDNTEIITHKSPEISLNVISDGQIPKAITVCSFQNDQTTNGLDSFFRPKSTILYFYKYINSDSTYQFADANNISKPNTSLNIKNNAFNITAPNMIFNNLGSVEKIITNNYTITRVNSYNSNLTDTTNFNFSDLYNLL